ncbi:MAG: histidine phosphatase family protein [Bacteroidales bacterium]|nr:histidine phosphatase family protein [Bacteroidales bacterium]
MKHLLVNSAIVLAATVAVISCTTENSGIRNTSQHKYASEGYEYFHTPYPESIAIYDTPAPSGYKVTNLWHIGRHGSRRPAGKGETTRALKVFDAAARAGLLTDEGKALHADILRMRDEFDGEIGELSARGGREHQAIAARIVKRYPSLFKGRNKKIHAVSSNSTRVIASMCNFCNVFKSGNTSFDYTFVTGDKWRRYVSRSDGSDSIYVYYRGLRNKYLEASLSPGTFASKYFTDPSAVEQLSDCPMWECVYRIFALGTLCHCNDLSDIDLCKYLEKDDMETCYKACASCFYCQSGLSDKWAQSRRLDAKVLSDDILTYGDSVAEGSAEYVCDLHFSHDTGIAALLALLGVDGFDKSLTFDQALEWDASKYICMAFNFDVIFYRNRKGDTLVKFLRNEEETFIAALTPAEGPYYRWSDVRDYLAN